MYTPSSGPRRRVTSAKTAALTQENIRELAPITETHRAWVRPRITYLATARMRYPDVLRLYQVLIRVRLNKAAATGNGRALQR